MMAVMWSMTALATLLVVTRLCVRQRLLRNFGLDDWLIGISMVIHPKSDLCSPMELGSKPVLILEAIIDIRTTL